MKTYLTIQYKRFCRISFEKRIHPIASFVFFFGAFVALSQLLFARASEPVYIYSGIGVVLLTSISTRKRIAFLQQCFKEKEFKQIRLIENISLAIPFVLFLAYKNQYYFSLGILVFSGVSTLLPLWSRPNLTIPTPFGKFPFEFTRGFRQFFFLYIAAYFISYYAVEANNYGFSIVILLATFLLSAAFYSAPEPSYYIWIYKHTPSQFLAHKFLTILRYSLLPSLPIIIVLLFMFPEQIWITLLASLTGLLYVTIFMLSKYLNHPNEMSITHSFIITGCIFFPPLMLVVLPLFYFRSTKNLSLILHD